MPPPGGQPPPPGYPPAPPGFQPPPPGFQPPPPGAFPPGGPQPTPKKGRGCLIAALVLGALIVFGIIAVAILLVVAADSVDTTFEQVDISSGDSDEDQSEQNGTATGGAEANDVGPCVVVDDDAIELDVTNNSSKQSTYVVDVNFLDANGQRVADESFFISDLRPGERAVEESFAFSLEGAASCEIAEVERFASESPDDTSEVTCEVTGLDFADDVEAGLVATNGSSGLSDYSINFAIIRDGVRVGTGFSTIENVRAGESAPGDGLTFVPGPAEGATCEVIKVSRTAS